MAKDTKIKTRKVIIRPIESQDYKENGAVCGAKRIPFDTPLVLSENDIKVIERQKIPAQRPKRIDPKQIMASMQITQEKANLVARQMEQDKDMGNEIYFRKRYIVEAA